MKTFRKYYTFEKEEDEASLGIKVLNIGHYIHPKNTAYPDSKHPDNYYFEWEKGRNLKEFQILYISQGSGVFEAIGLPPQPVEAGTAILLYPGIWHRYTPNQDTGWEEFWIGFTGSYAKHLLEQECFNPENPIIKIGLNAEFLETFSRLLRALEVQEDSHQKLASFILLQLLGIIYTSALGSKRKTSRKERIIGEAIREINKNWQSSIDFEKLAESHNVSYIWFRKAFKEQTDTSPHQYLLNVRLRKAEQLLRDTNLSQAEIAFQCGFKSEYYFSRVFKKKMGLNASGVRTTPHDSPT